MAVDTTAAIHQLVLHAQQKTQADACVTANRTQKGAKEASAVT
jgi:hypothetical protein